eukprot:scaffold39258_cov67-Phaeocystis_antarctica.AAC.2
MSCAPAWRLKMRESCCPLSVAPPPVPRISIAAPDGISIWTPPRSMTTSGGNTRTVAVGQTT